MSNQLSNSDDPTPAAFYGWKNVLSASKSVLVISNFNKDTAPLVHIDGGLAHADVDYFASFDSAQSMLWLTFAAGWSGTQRIEIE